MTKIFKFLFVFSLLAFAYRAEAKVCFLPGVFADDGCLGGTISGSDDSCAGYDSNPCPAGYKQETCTTKNGTTKYRCTCDRDIVYTPAQMKEKGYKCTTHYDSTCGCPRDYTICDRDIYPLAQGDGYCKDKLPNTNPHKECTNPSDNNSYKVKGSKVFYDMCVCSNYPYNCKSTGLTPPSNDYLSCTDSKGNKHYSACDCASNWSETPCNQRTDGCTEVSKKIDKLGTSDKCYLCSSYKCPNAGDINLEEYWCDVPQGLQTDCEKLGYTNAPNGACPNGEVTVKCPFNRKYMYCLSICNTAADTNCAEWSGTGKDCTCTTCKSGYELKNGKCEQKTACATGTYKTKSECETANPDAWKCTLNSAGCYEPKTLTKICRIGTYQTKEECVNAAGNGFRQLCTETSNGCWAPKNPTVSCSGYTLSKCPANGVCSTCPSDKSRFKLTGCNTNYYLDTDKCVSCASAKSSLESEAKLAANSWLTCCTAPNSGPTHGPVQAVGYRCGDAILSKKCRSSCTDYTSIGSWSDGCFRLGNQAPLNPTIPEMKNACLNVLTDVANRVKNFNNVCPNYEITASINPSRQCDNINCGGETTLVSGSGTYKGCKYGL